MKWKNKLMQSAAKKRLRKCTIISFMQRLWKTIKMRLFGMKKEVKMLPRILLLLLKIKLRQFVYILTATEICIIIFTKLHCRIFHLWLFIWLIEKAKSLSFLPSITTKEIQKRSIKSIWILFKNLSLFLQNPYSKCRYLYPYGHHPQTWYTATKI